MPLGEKKLVIETDGRTQQDNSQEIVFDFGQDNSCNWVKLNFASALRSSMFPTDGDDKTSATAHIEITAVCYKFQDRGYSEEQLFKRSKDRVKGDEEYRSNLT